jgi:polyhydroxybutyrate depolymerase
LIAGLVLVLMLGTACSAAEPGAAGGSAVSASAPDAAGPAGGCGRAPATPAGRTTEESLNSGGRNRTYLVHVPADYQPNRPLPVVLAFHGRKGRGTDIEGFSGFDGLNVLAVYPRGLPASDGETAWQGNPGVFGVDDVRFVADLLDRLRSTLCVDQNRMFASGKSEGAGFAALLACSLPNRIAAVGTVSGAFYPGTSAGCAGSSPVPLVDLHGTDDPIIHYDGGVSHRQRYSPMTAWLQGWATHNRCAPNPGASAMGPDATVLTWSGCAPGGALVHYRLAGGGHTWPGAQARSGPGRTITTISATSVLWTFFAGHPKS